MLMSLLKKCLAVKKGVCGKNLGSSVIPKACKTGHVGTACHINWTYLCTGIDYFAFYISNKTFYYKLKIIMWWNHKIIMGNENRQNFCAHMPYCCNLVTFCLLRRQVLYCLMLHLRFIVMFLSSFCIERKSGRQNLRSNGCACSYDSISCIMVEVCFRKYDHLFTYNHTYKHANIQTHTDNNL